MLIKHNLSYMNRSPTTTLGVHNKEAVRLHEG